MTAQMTDAYAAALIETRGELRTNTGGRQRPYRPTLFITIHDPGIAEALREWGGGRLETYSPKYDPTRTMYSWRVRGQACLRVLEATLPHLVGDKASHAKHILERDRTRQDTNGKHD
jgi:hypothetical protein